MPSKIRAHMLNKDADRLYRNYNREYSKEEKEQSPLVVTGTIAAKLNNVTKTNNKPQRARKERKAVAIPSSRLPLIEGGINKQPKFVARRGVKVSSAPLPSPRGNGLLAVDHAASAPNRRPGQRPLPVLPLNSVLTRQTGPKPTQSAVYL